VAGSSSRKVAQLSRGVCFQNYTPSPFHEVGVIFDGLGKINEKWDIKVSDY